MLVGSWGWGKGIQRFLGDGGPPGFCQEKSPQDQAETYVSGKCSPQVLFLPPAFAGLP